MADAQMSVRFRPTHGRVGRPLEIVLTNTSERNGTDLLLYPEMIAVKTPDRWVFIEPDSRALAISESAYMEFVPSVPGPHRFAVLFSTQDGREGDAEQSIDVHYARRTSDWLPAALAGGAAIAAAFILLRRR